jgi:photosystem II stability/assembly factor-like uncharacterized protein
MSILRFIFLLLLLFSLNIIGQERKYSDPMKPNSIFDAVPEEIRERKAFQRQWHFFETRAYPDYEIPEGAYLRAFKQREELRGESAGKGRNINWVSLGPTPGYYYSYGNISSRIVTGVFHPTNPNIMYIGPANGGVWKTTDSGINWTPLTDDQPSMAMGALAIDQANPEVIYAGTGEATYSGASYYGAGLLKSTNGGTTWQHITTGLPTNSYFSRITVRPGNSNQVLAALGQSSRGIYRSTDAGMTWTNIISGRGDDVIFTTSGDTAFALVNSSLYRSIDGGATFSVFGTGYAGGTRNHFDICTSNPAIMYAATYSSSAFRVYKSTNYGANWAQVSSGTNFNSGQAWYDLFIKVNPSNPDIVYLGTIDIWKSTNGGTSFTNITNGYSGGNVHVDQHNLIFHPTDHNTIISLNDGGIWRSSNGGTSFVNLNQNLTLTQFYRIAASPFTPSRILGGTQDNGTQQTYSALNWEAAYGGDGGEVSFNPFDANFILGETQNNGVFRTTNGGSSWSSATSGLSSTENKAWVAPIQAHPTINGTFFTARQRVYKSTNNGGTWTAVSPNVNGTTAVRELAISKSNPNIIFASSGASIFKSTDGGVTFSASSSGLSGRTVTSVYVHHTNPNTVVATTSGFGTNVFKSTNGGANWVNIHGNLPITPVNDILIFPDYEPTESSFFVATDIGIYFTSNNGTVWEDVGGDIPNTVIMHLDYSPSTRMVRAGTHGRGVFEAFIDTIVPVELTAFTAAAMDKAVVLNWTTATEINNSGFEVERKLKNEDWEKVGFIKGEGNSTQPMNYKFIDNFNDRSYAGRVLYRLKQIDYDGTVEYSKHIYVDVSFVPESIELFQNYPNPFNPVTSIKYALPLGANVRLSVYNNIGQKVEELVNGVQELGIHEVKWNGSNYASGIYYYSLEVMDMTGGLLYKDSKKLILMK